MPDYTETPNSRPSKRMRMTPSIDLTPSSRATVPGLLNFTTPRGRKDEVSVSSFTLGSKARVTGIRNDVHTSKKLPSLLASAAYQSSVQSGQTVVSSSFVVGKNVKENYTPGGRSTKSEEKKSEREGVIKVNNTIIRLRLLRLR